jgi:hypothetical protein
MPTNLEETKLTTIKNIIEEQTKRFKPKFIEPSVTKKFIRFKNETITELNSKENIKKTTIIFNTFLKRLEELEMLDFVNRSLEVIKEGHTLPPYLDLAEDIHCGHKKYYDEAFADLMFVEAREQYCIGHYQVYDKSSRRFYPAHYNQSVQRDGIYQIRGDQRKVNITKEHIYKRLHLKLKCLENDNAKNNDPLENSLVKALIIKKSKTPFFKVKTNKEDAKEAGAFIAYEIKKILRLLTPDNITTEFETIMRNKSPKLMIQWKKEVAQHKETFINSLGEALRDNIKKQQEKETLAIEKEALGRAKEDYKKADSHLKEMGSTITTGFDYTKIDKFTEAFHGLKKHLSSLIKNINDTSILLSDKDIKTLGQNPNLESLRELQLNLGIKYADSLDRKSKALFMKDKFKEVLTKLDEELTLSDPTKVKSKAVREVPPQQKKRGAANNLSVFNIDIPSSEDMNTEDVKLKQLINTMGTPTFVGYFKKLTTMIKIIYCIKIKSLPGVREPQSDTNTALSRTLGTLIKMSDDIKTQAVQEREDQLNTALKEIKKEISKIEEQLQLLCKKINERIDETKKTESVTGIETNHQQTKSPLKADETGASLHLHINEQKSSDPQKVKIKKALLDELVTTVSIKKACRFFEDNLPEKMKKYLSNETQIKLKEDIKNELESLKEYLTQNELKIKTKNQHLNTAVETIEKLIEETTEYSFYSSLSV